MFCRFTFRRLAAIAAVWFVAATPVLAQDSGLTLRDAL